VQKSPCRDVAHWKSQYQYTRMCYTDVVALYGAEELSAGKVPYVDHAVEYPVGIGAIMGGVAAVTGSDPSAAGYRHFFDVTWLLLSLAALTTVVCTALAGGRRRYLDAALVAAAPALLLHLTTNWDMAAVAFATAGILAWSRSRPLLAGVLLGLGAATKAYPALFLLPLLLLCLRARRLRAWWATAAGLVGAMAVLYVPAWVAAGAYTHDPNTPEGPWQKVGRSAWEAGRHDGAAAFVRALAPHHDGGTNGALRFLTLNSGRGADWDSLQFAVENLLRRTTADAGWTIPWERSALLGGPVNWSWMAPFGLVVIGLIVLVWRAPVPPRLGSLLFLTVAGFLLCNKVNSPQYVLWLLPLVAWARPRWPVFLAWQAAEVLVLLTRYAMFTHQQGPGGVGVSWFVAAVVLRDVILMVLAGLVVRDILRPQRDQVREPASGGPGRDPLAGPLSTAAPGLAAPRVAVPAVAMPAVAL
jgi:uncharacterized membrane protein